MLGVVYAMYLIESVLYTFLLTETLATFIGISVLGGIIWRRANRWGALASLIGALTTNFALYCVDGSAPGLLGSRTCFSRPSRSGSSLLVGVSLADRARARAGSIDSFCHGCRRRAMATTDTTRRSAGQQPLLLVDLLHLGRRGNPWKVYREDLLGFSAGWVIVFVLVVGTMWFLAV